MGVICWERGSGLGSEEGFKLILGRKFSRKMFRWRVIFVIYSISLENYSP